jgi:pantoate--beta-alanine ligase
MGALHAGHASLMRSARELAGAEGTVVVSLFVNPMQFGPGEDLDRYPRSFDADLRLCADEGVDMVFAPPTEEMYPDGEPAVTIDPGPLGRVLEGASRPGHFRGVLTAVAKLFHLVRPDAAAFGEKDYQQLVLIRRMVADLGWSVQVVGAPIVREPDGLAMSSRNSYLDAGERVQAVALSRALQAGVAASAGGAAPVLAAAHAVLDGSPDVDCDYLELTDPELGPAPAEGEARLLVAARVGATRLIDNIALRLGKPDDTADTLAP